jgi:hypothetical protein
MESLQILGYIFVFGIGGWLALRVRKWRAVFSMKHRFAVGAKAELDAVSLLKKHGYTVLGDQVSGQNVFLVDGKEVTSVVRADFRAEKDGKSYIVEVKSGDSAPSPRNSATRRQLLEYEHVFRPDGLILADMREGTLKSVDFGLQKPRPVAKRSRAGWRPLLIAAVAGLVVGLLLGAG